MPDAIRVPRPHARVRNRGDRQMMPKVIGNDSLIARVNEVEGCMHRQSNELGRLNKAVRRYKEENAKLRKMVRELWDVALHPETFGDGSYLLGRIRDLGIEVDGDTET